MNKFITCVLLTMFFGATISLAQVQWNQSGDNYTTGSLSLGTSAVTDKLSIEGDGKWHIRLKDISGGQDWRIGSTGTGWAAGAGKFIISNNTSSTNASVVIDNQRKVGIGTYNPQAFLDVGAFIPNGTLGTVLGRLSEGNTTGSGTYLGVRGYATQQDQYDGKSFSFEHAFYGNVNSSINFFRGIGVTGGFMTFNTNTNIERMRISPNGYVGIGNTNPQALLDVSGNLVLRNGNNVSLAGASIHLTSLGADNPGPMITSRLHYAQGTESRSALLLSSYQSGYKNELYIYDGRVGIGTTAPDATLAVKGTIHTQEVQVDMTGAMVPDYVFEKNYNLRTLAEVENYIKENKHLPEVPAAKDMEANGVNLGEMYMLLLKKVEELTLYLIEKDKQIKQLEQVNLKIEERLSKN